jgi:TatD DNase family protein
MFMDVHRASDISLLDNWLQTENPVAVGECGLDFFIDDPDRDGQRRLFEAQLELAKCHGLPVIVHARRALEDVLDILRRYPDVRGVVHSFSGSEQQARRLIDMGFLMSFGGPVTYPRARRLRHLAAVLPLESIMIETDSPDQPDVDIRGRRNEPVRLPRILAELGLLRKESEQDIAAVTRANAIRLFGLSQSPGSSGRTPAQG